MTTNPSPGSIIFDADDTLWITEELYDRARDKFVEYMMELTLGPENVVYELAKQIDKENFKKLRLSRHRFPSSLVQTYEQRCKDLGREIDNAISQKVRAIGEEVFQQRTELLSGVNETLQTLQSAGYSLYLWTQGDEEIQRQRIDQSGLRSYFQDTTGGDRIVIDDEKNDKGLEVLMKRHGLIPGSTWLVGNSSKSDVQLAIQARLRTAWIPQVTWNEENTLDRIQTDQVFLLEQFVDLKELFVDSQPSEAICEGEVAYLFVSAYHRLYRQYVLDILASPRDFVIRFPYRDLWLPKSGDLAGSASSKAREAAQFCACLNEQKLRSALVVFVDERVQGEPRRTPRFLPIRTAAIISAELHGDLIQIEFKMGDYVCYDNPATDVKSFNEFIQSLPYRPHLNPTRSAYVALGQTYQGRIHTEKSANRDPDKAWQSIVRVISTMREYATFSVPSRFPPIPNPFENTMFYRVQGLLNLKNGKEVELQSALQIGNKTAPQSNDVHAPSGFRLRGNAQYALELAFYSTQHPTSVVRGSSIEVALKPETVLIPIGQTKIPLDFSYDIRRVLFATPRTFENLRASISLAMTSSSAITDSEDQQPMAPAPSFLVTLASSRILLFVAAIAYFFGSLLVSAPLRDFLSNLIVARFPDLGLDSTTLSFLLGGLGSAVTTAVIVVLYRSVK